MKPPPIVVGLTGGIGSGKSTAASIFHELGALVIDADAIVQKLLDRPAVRRDLARAFGKDVVRRKRVDRAAVAARAFVNEASVRRLNRIVHPRVRREVQKRLNAARRKKKWAVLDAALMMETGAYKFCDVLIFIDVPRTERERRVKKRGWSPGELRRRERAQWPVAKKKKYADYVLKNTGSKAALRKQLKRVLQEIIQ